MKNLPFTTHLIIVFQLIKIIKVTNQEFFNIKSSYLRTCISAVEIKGIILLLFWLNLPVDHASVVILECVTIGTLKLFYQAKDDLSGVK